MLYYTICINRFEKDGRADFFNREPIWAFTFKPDADETKIRNMVSELNAVLEKYLDHHHYENQIARFFLSEHDD